MYKGLDIGTAKPTIDERAGIPHHMIDIVEPEVDYSVGVYAQTAGNIINDIISRAKTPIIAGGTGLYFRILLENYDLPKISPDYELRKELSQLEFDELYEMLLKLDSEAAKLVIQNDKRRAIRFIEIVKLTGMPVSEARGIKEPEYEVEWIGLNYPRAELYERINKRVDLMLEQGLVDETRKLLKEHGRISNIINTIGYREITSYLDGELTLNEAADKLKQNTRNYAKRQLTWFRKNPDIKWNCYPDRKKK